MRWAAALLLAVAALAQAETWRFAVIGDTPYSARERAELPKMLERIGEDDVSFIAHVGDIKSGQQRCDDALFADRHQLFDTSRVPFVFVPGDNEWADCERMSNGHYDPAERLDRLRGIFWNTSETLGRRRFALERQSGDYVEHSRFRVGPVLFVTLNLPGPDNNRGLADVPRPEFVRRNPVVLAWMRESFEMARRDKLAGVVLLFQANPGFRNFAQGLAHGGFREFLEGLRDESANFPGQVVVVHGDTHVARIDRPLHKLSGKTMDNFVRVETFGYPVMGWTVGTIDTDAPGLFRFATHPWPEPGR